MSELDFQTLCQHNWFTITILLTQRLTITAVLSYSTLTEISYRHRDILFSTLYA